MRMSRQTSNDELAGCGSRTADPGRDGGRAANGPRRVRSARPSSYLRPALALSVVCHVLSVSGFLPPNSPARPRADSTGAALLEVGGPAKADRAQPAPSELKIVSYN